MALPHTKQELADWILRRLGAPVVNVEITDEQLEDAIDEAVQFFQEYHYDGAERAYRVIKIEADVLHGNARRHHGMTAPMYDVTMDDTYRVGDRVMTYKPDGTPDKIWVRYDSEEKVRFVTYVLDSDGQYFFEDSDLNKVDFYSYFEEVIDSDSGFSLYDSDLHNRINYFLDVRVDQVMVAVALAPGEDPSPFFADSDGEYVAYDSDKHTYFDYSISSDGDVTAIWALDSEGTIVPRDSDQHYTVGYEIDIEGTLVDSDGEYVTYDSDKHSVYQYTILPNQIRTPGEIYWYNNGFGEWYQYGTDQTIGYLYTRSAEPPTRYNEYKITTNYKRETKTVQLFQRRDEDLWVDSEGEFAAYDSDKHSFFVYDSEERSIGTVYFVDSEGEYVLYDSDKHVLTEYMPLTAMGKFFVHRSLWLVDSDGVLVSYDSDKHVEEQLIPLDSQTELLIPPELWLVDSDGTWVTYDSDKHTYKTYVISTVGLTSRELVKFDSETGVDSEGAAIGLYVHVPDVGFFQYDSDSLSSLFYDSDGLGNRGEFRMNLDWFRGRTTDSEIINSDSEYETVYDLREMRYYRNREVPAMFYATAKIPQRFTRQMMVPALYNRETLPLGSRFSRVVQTVDKTPLNFRQLWREEDNVLVEPTVDFDYSKEGHVGIPIPDNIIGINKVFRIDNFSGMGMWNYEYQYFLNNFDFFYGNGGGSSGAMTNYYITKSYMDMIDNIMNVQPAIRFSKHRNRLYIDTNWSRLKNMAKSKDYYMMVECYEVNDPEVFGDVYKDKWLKRYSTVLAKQQWGANMKKYSNMELPGGLMVDGQALYDEATEEKQELEEQLKSMAPEMDFIIG